MMKDSRLTRLLGRRFSWERVGGYVLAAWVALQVTETLASLVGLPLWFGKAVLVLLGVGLVMVLLTAVLQGAVDPASRESGAGGRLRRVFTWRHATVAGLAGFALLGMGTAGHMAARSLGFGPVGTLLARGVLEDGELVLADFEDHAGDGQLARALTQAFRVHLSQSPTVLLASPARVAAVLQRMEVEESGPLGRDRAREVAIREGLKAVVVGEIHRIGSRYTVSATLMAAETGEELITAIETADQPGELISAVEQLSVRLRERVGESLASIRQSPPLSRVRTSSLPALEAYTEAADANGRGDFERCALLNEEAIALDSMFAMAYVGRAACNQNLNRDRARQIADRIRAYRMRDRMTERERLHFTAVYHQFVTEDRSRAVEAWEAYAERYPDSPSAIFALANLYAERRDYALAEETLRRGLELDPSSLIVLINLSQYQTGRGSFDEAEATLQRAERELPGLDFSFWRAGLRFAQGDWDGVRAELAAGREAARGSPDRKAYLVVMEALLAMTRGRIAEAEGLLEEAITTASASGDIANFHQRSALLAGIQLHFRNDTARAVRILEDALAAHPLESLEPLDRRYFELADRFIEAGRIDRGRRLIDAWRQEVAPLIPGSAVPAWLRASLAAAEGRYSDALAEWRLEDEVREDPVLILANIGHLHDLLGRSDSALAYYRRYLTTPSRSRYNSDPYWRARVLERLGELHEERGANEDAARCYAELLDLWAGADPELQPRVERARTRLQALTVEG